MAAIPRSAQEQAAHDIALAAIAAQHYSDPAWEVRTNPGDERTFTLGDHAPDLVVLGRESGGVILLGEVETASTVTVHEAVQWAQFARIAPLDLFVPFDAVASAHDLTTESGVVLHELRRYRLLCGLVQILRVPRA